MDQASRLEKMYEESILILRSICWLEKQLNKKRLELQRALANNRFDEAELLDNEILLLLEKVRREDKIMDNFMAKYKNLISHEKEAMLPNNREKD